MTWEEEREGKIGHLVTRAKVLVNAYFFASAVYNFVNVYVKVIHAYYRKLRNYRKEL